MRRQGQNDGGEQDRLLDAPKKRGGAAESPCWHELWDVPRDRIPPPVWINSQLRTEPAR